MMDTGETRLLDRLHKLETQVAIIERTLMSLQNDIQNAAKHTLDVDAALSKLKPDYEDRVKWNEAKRKVQLHLVMWGAPLVVAWVIFLFGSGLRGWVRQWLGV